MGQHFCKYRAADTRRHWCALRAKRQKFFLLEAASYCENDADQGSFLSTWGITEVQTPLTVRANISSSGVCFFFLSSLNKKKAGKNKKNDPYNPVFLLLWLQKDLKWAGLKNLFPDAPMAFVLRKGKVLLKHLFLLTVTSSQCIVSLQECPLVLFPRAPASFLCPALRRSGFSDGRTGAVHDLSK